MLSENLIKFTENRYDPRDLITVFLRLAAQEMERLGIRLILQSDFERLLVINRANKESWFPLMPMFDHTCCELDGHENAFWIEGQDSSGRTVLAQCARKYSIPFSSLKCEIESMTFFYDSPKTMCEPGEYISCASPSAPHISRQVCYSGGAWLDPGCRGIGIMGILPRISRSLALLKWNTDYTVSFVEEVLIRKGVTARYGYRLAEPGIKWRNSRIHGDLDLHLIWMDSPMLLRDLSSSMKLVEAA